MMPHVPAAGRPRAGSAIGPKAALRRRIAGAVGRALGLAVACAQACTTAAPKPWAAHLEALRPDVQVRAQGAAADLVGLEQQGLAVGDVVKTGEHGEVDVVFAGNNRIHLGENASLLVETSGASGTELGAAVLTGAVSVAGGGAGIGLSVRSPLGRVHLAGTHVSVLDVSVDQGMAVRVGEVSLDSPHSDHAVTLTVGQAVTVARMGTAQQLVIGTAPQATTLAPMDVAQPREPFARAKAAHGNVRVKASADAPWANVAAGTSFAAGDTVQVDAGAAAVVEIGKQATLSLDGNNELTFAPPQSPAGKPMQFVYALQGGHARLRTPRARTPTVHTIHLNGTSLSVAPGPQQADVAMAHRGAQTDVVVRFGTCTLGDGTVVHAGQKVVLAGGNVVSEPEDAFDGAVWVERRRPSVIFYQREVPPIRFAGSDRAGRAQTVRFGQDARIRHHPHEELLHHNAFVTDAVSAGRTYWRLGNRGRAQTLDVVMEPQRATGEHGREVDLDDTGQTATVYYDNAVPTLSLHWPTLEGAARYHVSFGVDDGSGIWLHEQTTTATEMAVPASKVAAHKQQSPFRWQVQPVSAEGAALGEPTVNRVDLRFATQARGLRLHSPAQNATTDAATYTVEGEAEPHCTVWINGKHIDTTAQGRFLVKWPLEVGRNALVFRLVKRGRADRVYVRIVSRSA